MQDVNFTYYLLKFFACFVFEIDTNEDKSSGIQFMSEVGSRCNGKNQFHINKFIISQKNLENGFYPDRDDCRKFHVCYGGTQSVRWCKDGMLWDETKIGCSSQASTACIGGRKKWGQGEGNDLLK